MEITIRLAKAGGAAAAAAIFRSFDTERKIGTKDAPKSQKGGF